MTNGTVTAAIPRHLLYYFKTSMVRSYGVPIIGALTGSNSIGTNITLSGDLWLLVSIFWLTQYSWEPEASGHRIRLYFDVYLLHNCVVRWFRGQIKKNKFLCRVIWFLGLVQRSKVFMCVTHILYASHFNSDIISLRVAEANNLLKTEKPWNIIVIIIIIILLILIIDNDNNNSDVVTVIMTSQTTTGTCIHTGSRKEMYNLCALNCVRKLENVLLT